MTEYTMTTYSRADGEQVHGEYGWVTDLDHLRDTAHHLDEPEEYVEEVWVRQSTQPVWIFPPLHDCGDCDEDAVKWERDEDGEWLAVCELHHVEGAAR